MNELIKLTSANSTVTIAVSVAVVIIACGVTLLYVAAFFQGRAVSFWPPRIGPHQKPPSDLAASIENGTWLASEGDSSQNPIVKRGSVLKSSSGKKYKVQSDFYGGANATLFKVAQIGGRLSIAKVYWRGLQPNSPPWALFQQEVRAAEILNHRNIVATLDRGLHGGYPFTIMEYLSGGTLRDWLRTHDVMKGDDILSTASQVGAAIDYAHSRGVIHRDVNPGNILFDGDHNGRVALSDFGIAAILGAIQRDITAIGSDFAGSPAYLAPEIIEGNFATPAMDIYSFWVILFEMICKRPPFDDYQNPWSIMQAKTNQESQDIRSIRSDVPSAIAERLAKTLRINPALRPTSASAVLSGLEEPIRRL